MAENPRIFHLITRLIRGGAEAKTIRAAAGLAETYDFTIGHGASFDPGQVAELEAMGIGTRRFSTIRHYNPLTPPAAVVSVARHLRGGGYDVVHTHSTEAGIIGRLAAYIAGVPAVVHTVHGSPFAVDRSPLLNGFVLACERAVAPLTDRIVFNADVLAEEYRERGIGRPEQYVTVYSGIDLDRFRGAEPAADLDDERLRIAMIGRVVEGKGFEVLLDAVERLRRDDVAVTIVGEGPLRGELEEEIVERGLDDVVSSLGFREDVPAVLAATDVFVLPSYREGTPRVITEAMASGLPVVASDVGGVPEQVVDGENGYLIPPGDAAALVDRIERLLEDPDRRAEFGAAGRTRAERFAEGSMVTDLAAVYADLLEG